MMKRIFAPDRDTLSIRETLYVTERTYQRQCRRYQGMEHCTECWCADLVPCASCCKMQRMYPHNFRECRRGWTHEQREWHGGRHRLTFGGTMRLEVMRFDGTVLNVLGDEVHESRPGYLHRNLNVGSD